MIIIAQIILVVGVLASVFVLLKRGATDKSLAIRRVMVLIFAIFAVISIFVPQILTGIASFFGIGRGTDLVLYALVVSFLVYMATMHQRFKRTEAMITKLARRISIDEAPTPEEVARRIASESREIK